MDNTKTTQPQTEDYNTEPVTFCNKCLSLNIRIVEDADYCDDCGNTHMAEASIAGWQHLYGNRYGEDKIVKPKK